SDSDAAGTVSRSGSSWRPLTTVARDSPVAARTRVTPPLPIALASAAAQRRQSLSFKAGRRDSNLLLMIANADMDSPSSIAGKVQGSRPPFKGQDERAQARTREPSQVESLGFDGPEPSAVSVPLAALGMTKVGLCAR